LQVWLPPIRCHIVTLGNLFMHMPLVTSTIIWYQKVVQFCY